jgi:hypothetical protein
MADRQVSPSGKVAWAYLERPNTKFSEEGEYQLAFTMPRKELIHHTKRMEMTFCLSLSRNPSSNLRMERKGRLQSV